MSCYGNKMDSPFCYSRMKEFVVNSEFGNTIKTCLTTKVTAIGVQTMLHTAISLYITNMNTYSNGHSLESTTLKASVTQEHWLSIIIQNKNTNPQSMILSKTNLISVVDLVYLILVFEVFQRVYGPHPDGILWWQAREKQDSPSCVYH